MPNKHLIVKGFTLVEVMVALLIMAMIAVTSAGAFNSAASGSRASREAIERLAEIDRAFVLLENDLRNALPVIRNSENGRGEPLLPLYINISEDYWLTVLRAGVENPLFQRRTEEVRVGYRYIDEELWRDTWYNPSSSDEELARKRRILKGVDFLSVEVLPPNANSITNPWSLTWPPSSQPAQFPTQLPRAVRVKIQLTDMGEIVRTFSILPGLAMDFGAPNS